MNGVNYHLAWQDGRPAFQEQRDAKPAETYTAEFVLGHTPLRQYVVPVGGGRYQAADLTFDPAKKEWFNVFGDERREPGEWGHWRGRGMNWNSMCAHCHLTDYRKNYDAATDTYATTWREHGVGCAQRALEIGADRGLALGRQLVARDHAGAAVQHESPGHVRRGRRRWHGLRRRARDQVREARLEQEMKLERGECGSLWAPTASTGRWAPFSQVEHHGCPILFTVSSWKGWEPQMRMG